MRIRKEAAPPGESALLYGPTRLPRASDRFLRERKTTVLFRAFPPARTKQRTKKDPSNDRAQPVFSAPCVNFSWCVLFISSITFALQTKDIYLHSLFVVAFTRANEVRLKFIFRKVEAKISNSETNVTLGILPRFYTCERKVQNFKNAKNKKDKKKKNTISKFNRNSTKNFIALIARAFDKFTCTLPVRSRILTEIVVYVGIYQSLVREKKKREI